MLTENQKKDYDNEGYLLVEDVLSQDQLTKINKITNDLIEKSRNVNESNSVYDLEEGHSHSSPRLTRIKQPHQVDKYFWDIIKESKIEGILKDLLGPDVSLKTSKLNTK